MAQWMQCNWIQQTPTWADSVCSISTNSGGYGPIPSGRRRDPDEVRQERVRLGILPEVQKVIEDVALRQVEALSLDEQQRLDELQGELRLQGIEMESAYIAALNERREQLINAEIARRIRAKMDSEAVALLLLMAAAV